MNIRIIQIIDKGIPNNERLWLKALRNLDLSHYVVINTNVLSNGNIMPYHRECYWFPKKIISAGDTIVLYSRIGTDNEIVNKDGTKTHFFYWGNKSTLWGKVDSAAVVLEITGWGTAK